MIRRKLLGMLFQTSLKVPEGQTRIDQLTIGQGNTPTRFYMTAGEPPANTISDGKEYDCVLYLDRDNRLKVRMRDGSIVVL